MRILLCFALVSCAWADRAALATATAATVCDWGGTARGASSGWRGTDETNELLGRRPDSITVAGYFATVLAGELAAWLALPRGYRGVVLGAVAAVELDTTAFNVDAVGWCGR